MATGKALGVVTIAAGTSLHHMNRRTRGLLSLGKDGKAFLPGGVGETVVQSYERELRGPLFARGQEGGELQCVRGPQRVDAQKPIGSRADRLRRQNDRRDLVEAKQPLRGSRELCGVQFTGPLSPMKT